MRKTYFYLFGALAIIVLGRWIGAHYTSQEKEINRLRTELAHSQKYVPLRVDTIRDSVVVYSQEVVPVVRKDYKRELADKALIKDLKLKVARLESEQTQVVSTHDTIYLKEAGDSVFEYKDEWAAFRVELADKRLSYNVRDSITTYVEKVPKKRFLWWTWGVRGYKVKVVNFNPHSTIDYQTYYKVEK